MTKRRSVWLIGAMVLALATGALVVATNPGSHDRGNRFLTPTVAPGIEPHQRPASVEKRVLDALGPGSHLIC